jgi:hypothetical protein
MDDKRGWLTSETAILMEAWSRAESVYALAHSMGRSRMAVLVHATRIGLPARDSLVPGRRKWTQEELARIDQEYQAVVSGRKPDFDAEGLSKEMDRSFDAILTKLEKRWGGDAIAKVEPSSMRRRDGRHHVPGLDNDLLKANWTPEIEVLRRAPDRGPKQRNCLSCGKSFWSEGAHNRICHHCKTTKDWN